MELRENNDLQSALGMFFDNPVHKIDGKPFADSMPIQVMVAKVEGRFYGYRITKPWVDEVTGVEGTHTNYEAVFLDASREYARRIGANDYLHDGESLEVLEYATAYYGLVAFPNTRVYRTRVAYRRPEFAVEAAMRYFETKSSFVSLGVE